MKHLSISQLNMFYRCPEQYRRRYILGNKIPPGIAAYVGIATHRASEKNFLNKMHYHENMEKDDLKDVAATEYDRKINNVGVFIPFDERPAAHKLLAKGKDAAVALISPLYDEYFPTVSQPVFVEKEFYLHENNLPPINGFIDLFDDTGRLSDLKTKSSRMSQEAADSSLQITAYSQAIKRMTGKFPVSNTLDVIVKNKNPIYKKIITKRYEDDWLDLKKRFHLMYKQIRAGLFPPADPSSWICNKKWCGYWYTCKYISIHKKVIPKVSK